MVKRRTYTVMCHDVSGTGTIWIEPMTCRTAPDGSDDIAHIEKVAKARCARDWLREHENGRVDTSEIHCLAIARGRVQFVTFDDYHL